MLLVEVEVGGGKSMQAGLSQKSILLHTESA